MSFDLRRELNPEQYLAASTIDGPLLIIAGAGSGKTRMLTFRVAHMLENGISPHSILALTFTNKAAAEMAERIHDLTGVSRKELMATTFHAFGMKLLKKYIHLLGYKDNFTIFDASDVQTLLSDVIHNLGYEEADYNFFELASLFSDVKTGRASFRSDGKSELSHVYTEYQKSLKAYNALDFDDLIMLPLRLFAEHPETLAEIRKTYSHILVDEFQDTSLTQYSIVKELAWEHRNLCVVGDDDQSIYSWRGANYRNIIMFESDFPERLEIKLERNYRSTGTILEAANNVIVHNTERKSKKLWTQESVGSMIHRLEPKDEDDEAAMIIGKIRELRFAHDYPWKNFGVLVRTNHMLPVLENRFLLTNTPCKISGGASFFDRKEVKDIISYLRLLVNTKDDVSFLRVINVPRRGIGRKTIEKIRATAESNQCSLHEACSLVSIATDSGMKGNQKKTLADFFALIEDYREKLFHAGKNKSKVLMALVENISYKDYVIDQYPTNEKAVNFKMGSIRTFNAMFGRWERDPDNNGSSVFDYLNRLALSGKENTDDDDKVHLMTMHASKGLEFAVVFLAGIEDHIIPHARTLEENQDSLAEERRLFYVALTRARKHLYISTCMARHRGKELTASVPSRFLLEIPAHLVTTEDEEAKPASKEDLSRILDKFKAKLDAK
ncbi:ATP-dependent helicase [Parasphaerochaeta coccoides]|uniref:DNA 3'-5' helicase n=1 Tax=Parasphaerochaeta coccoides (strain ATCC BAA-1237 / DSM 17374 / SPN1) TaxID=760011 RepID=F4GLJ9_PARC1|nr:UvrD-helicase domain-containing protein [Parasphaerochaeta coccoides]AEC01969.1 UvrD/REP helicase [Parasphaerochaeta coccoides DSM 17374]